MESHREGRFPLQTPSNLWTNSVPLAACWQVQEQGSGWTLRGWENYYITYYIRAQSTWLHILSAKLPWTLHFSEKVLHMHSSLEALGITPGSLWDNCDCCCWCFQLTGLSDIFMVKLGRQASSLSIVGSELWEQAVRSFFKESFCMFLAFFWSDKKNVH